MVLHPAEPVRIALIAMPWPLFNRPSIQLASLKAFLDREAGDWLEVDLFHPYLAVARRLGPELYHAISKNMWLCEALYTPLLFPKRRQAAQQMVADILRQMDDPPALDFDHLSRSLALQVQEWIAGRDWDRYQLIGFSICFNQLFSSLAAAGEVKKKAPGTPVVFGGSLCAPEVAAGLLRAFTQIDFLVSGEGERPLFDLCRFLAGKVDSLPPAVTSRDQDSPTALECQQLPDLTELPVPDYRDYFKEMGAQFAEQPFLPVLPVEFSRGCWWRKCTFCNLNLQWSGYRMKKASRMEEEVLTLAATYGCLDFTFTDNALPPKEAVAFFKKLPRREVDFRFFGEIRVQHSPEELAFFGRGGLRTVQAGIEALSTSLLQRMRKGVRTIDNIAALKFALASGILLQGNLITEFPGSEPGEIEETLRNLDYVFPFPPLTTAGFFLGHGSPVDSDPARFGIRAVVQHPRFARLFPKEILAGLTLLVKDYRGDRQAQQRQWRPVTEKVARWQRAHHRRGKALCEQPLLAYRDGGSFLLIRQELSDGHILHHRLRGTSRRIYLYCDAIRKVSEIQGQFPAFGETQLLAFLDDLTAKRLMFREEEEYLSLAVRGGSR